MLHQVGVGALGPVFRTYEPTRDRLVAVKVFRLDVTPEQAQSLADELSTAAEAGLFHPSVVEPIAAGVEGTVAYRAEEYVAAETLDVALRHYAPAPIDKVLPLITQLAGAIDFARTSGVGHGALHPRDIFVTPEEARATGFGVVEALERVGLRAPVRRPYSAPERVAGAAWGTPADVFSLAAIAYELLTGRRPAGTGSQIGAVTGSSAGHHPGALHAVFVQAMDDDPAGRYPTALAFASALDAAARGEALAAAGVSPSAGVAGLATLTAPEAIPDDLEDAVEDLPPLQDLDAKTEPVQAEQEEDLFRAEEPEFDDVLAEQTEDDAHAALLREEADAEGGAADRLLFDDEAVEDLALDAPARAETERFADEFTLAASALAADSRSAGEIGDGEEAEDEYDADAPASGAVPIGRYEEEHDASAAFGSAQHGVAEPYDRPRRAMLPTAVAVILALLVGFAAGHAVGKRSPANGGSETIAGGPPAADPAQPYSEETLNPPEPLPADEPPVATEPLPVAAAAPAAAAPETRAAAGRLVVRSTPSRANVTVDGTWRGRTPLTLDKVPFGSRDVRVVLPGHAVASEAVTLSSGAPSRTLSFRLRRTAPATKPSAAPPRSSQAAPPRTFSGSIYVDSRPRGARILLDGKAVGRTPLRIPDVSIGSHVIRLQLPDHRDWTAAARVVAGEEARVTGSLDPIR